MADPASAAARAVDELTDVALDGLPMTDVDRVEADLLRERAGLRPCEEPDEDEEPCRCCAGPLFGQGTHVHDDQTCEHPCCPDRDA